MHDVKKSQGQQSRSHLHLPHFSLLTLLLVVAILSLSITVVHLWREVEPLRADNKRLNEERGTLVVDDPSRPHAIRIPERIATLIRKVPSAMLSRDLFVIGAHLITPLSPVFRWKLLWRQELQELCVGLGR